MKKIMLMLVIFLLLPVAAHATELKVGIIDVTKVLTQSEVGKDADLKLRTMANHSRSLLEPKKLALEKMEAFAKKNAPKSEKDRAQKVKKFQDAIKDYQQTAKVEEAKISNETVKLREPIIKKLDEVIKAYGTTNGFSMILDTRSSGVIFANNSLDITENITQALNKAFK